MFRTTFPCRDNRTPASGLRRWLHAALAALVVAIGTPAPAARAAELTVWVGREGELQQSFVDALREQTERGGQHSIAQVRTPGSAQAAANPKSIIVAVGAEAAQAAIAEGATALLAVLVSRRDVDNLRSSAPQARLTAIVLDQPLARRLTMLRTLAPGTESVVALVGPATAARSSEIESAAAALGMKARIANIADESQIVPTLDRLLTEGSALLAMPDASIYNRNTVMSILLTTYRHRKPVIGFTAAYVRAGAVAAVFSSPGDIAAQVAEVLAGVAGPEQLVSRVLAPSRFEVSINERVSRALGLPPISEAELAARIAAAEAKP